MEHVSVAAMVVDMCVQSQAPAEATKAILLFLQGEQSGRAEFRRHPGQMLITENRHGATSNVELVR